MQRFVKKEEVPRKFNIEDPSIWPHHRCGWKCAMKEIDTHLENSDGILLVSNADLLFYKTESLNVPWVGYVHAVIESPIYYKNLYKQYWDLKRFLKRNILNNCLGLYTFSSHVKDYIKDKTSVPVDLVYHPTDSVDELFDYNRFIDNPNKKIVLVGQWMRDWQAIYDFPVLPPYDSWPAGKYILTGSSVDYKMIRSTFFLDPNATVKQISRLSNKKYDELLTENIIFLPLFDLNACNTLIECIVRNTPLLTNRLPASEEYLGKDYPFFYEKDDLDSAAEMASDMDLIKQTTDYLCNMNKTFLEPKTFLEMTIHSDIYKNL